MQDYWNDPPDEPELPECCGEVMEYDVLTDTCKCSICERKIESAPDIEPIDEPKLEELPDDFFSGPPLCPHGKEWTDCGACDHASDLAYDAARESRFSR